jgi:methyl-accepting chemotaxis protein
MLLQDTLDGQNVHWLMIFVGIAAFALLAQAIALIVLAGGALKGQKALAKQIDGLMVHVSDIKAKVLPLLATSNTVVTDLKPQLTHIAGQVKVITAHVEEISGVLRDKVQEFAPTISAANDTVQEANATLRAANARTLEQVNRVNGMVTSVLDATASFGKTVEKSVTTPLAQVSGIVEGVRTGLSTFIGSFAKARPPVYRAPSGTYEPPPRYEP